MPRRSGQGTDRLHSNEPGTYADSIHHIEGFFYILYFIILLCIICIFDRLMVQTEKTMTIIDFLRFEYDASKSSAAF